MKLIFKAILVTSLLVTAPVNGAIIKAVPTDNTLIKEHYLSIKGRIEKGDKDKLEKIIYLLKNRGINFNQIRLNSGGGDLSESIAIAKIIAANNLPANVLKGEGCVNACMIMFSNGHKKIFASGSIVGIFNASGNSEDNEFFNHISKEFRTKQNTSKIPIEILKTLTTPTSKTKYYLSDKELNSFNQ